MSSWVPFRCCLLTTVNQNLAWHEMRLLLSTVLLHFDLELCKESAKWTEQRVYTLWEKPALMCKLTLVKV